MCRQLNVFERRSSLGGSMQTPTTQSADPLNTQVVQCMVGQLVVFFNSLGLKEPCSCLPPGSALWNECPPFFHKTVLQGQVFASYPRIPISISFCELFWGRGADDTWPWNGTPVFQAIQSLLRMCPMFSCLVAPVKTISTDCVSKMQRSLS